MGFNFTLSFRLCFGFGFNFTLSFCFNLSLAFGFGLYFSHFCLAICLGFRFSFRFYGCTCIHRCTCLCRDTFFRFDLFLFLIVATHPLDLLFRRHAAEAEAQALFVGIDVQDAHQNFVAGPDNVLDCSRPVNVYLADVDQPHNAGLDFDEGTKVFDVGHSAFDQVADVMALFNRVPRVGQHGLAAETNSFPIDVDVLDFHL